MGPRPVGLSLYDRARHFLLAAPKLLLPLFIRFRPRVFGLDYSRVVHVASTQNEIRSKHPCVVARLPSEQHTGNPLTVDLTIPGRIVR